MKLILSTILCTALLTACENTPILNSVAVVAAGVAWCSEENRETRELAVAVKQVENPDYVSVCP